MTLLEIVEPIFQYVCRLSRSARKSAGLEPSLVRADIKQIFNEMRAKAGEEPGMSQQFEQVELPLIYFVDFMIKESSLPFARAWQELAHEQNKLAGDEEFFDLLDDTLKDPTEKATERLTVFYTCLGLGFTGFYAGQPEFLRKKMQEITARIRDWADWDKSGRVSPEAYEHVDTRNLVRPPGRSLIGFAVAIVAAALVVIAGNAYLYATTSGDLRGAIRDVRDAVGGGASLEEVDGSEGGAD